MNKPLRPLSQQFAVGDLVVDVASNLIVHGDAATRVEPKVIETLVFLAANAGEVVSRDAILDAVWNRGGGADESLTRVISQLRKALDAAPGGRGYIETVPKRGYRLTAPVAALETGRSNLMEKGSRADTPERPASTSSAGPSAHAAAAKALPSGRQWLLHVVAAFALVLIVVSAVAVFAMRPAQTRALDRIAAPEFATPAGDETLAAFALAAHDALVRDLVRAKLDATASAPDRRTGLVVRGEAISTSSGASLSIRVLSAQGGEALWTKRYPIGLANDAVTPDFAAWDVAGVLQCAASNLPLGVSTARQLGHHIRACDSWRTVGFEPMLIEGRRMLGQYPDLAAARLLVATAAAWVSLSVEDAGARVRLADETRRLVGETVFEGAASGRSHYALAVSAYPEMDWITIARELEYAQQREPLFPYIYNSLMDIARRTGRISLAADYAALAVAADPFSNGSTFTRSIMLGADGEISAARTLIEAHRKVLPEEACVAEFFLDHWYGDAAAARRSLDQGCFNGKISGAKRDCAEAYLGFRLDEASRAAALEACRGETFFPAIRYHAALGDVEGALAIGTNSPVRWSDTPVFFYPEMSPLHRDPRFMDIAARYRLAEFWIETDQWPDFCRLPQLPYDCRAEAAAVIARSSARPVAGAEW